MSNTQTLTTGVDLVKLEAVQIGHSPPAPLLTLIVGPSEESREVGDVKKKFSDRHHQREYFWTHLLNHADTRTNLHNSVSPSKYAWLGTGAGVSGIGFNYVVRQHEVRAELYIHRGKEAADENEAEGSKRRRLTSPFSVAPQRR